MFPSVKGKQQKQVQQLQCEEERFEHIPVTFRDWGGFRFSGQERLSTTLWFISLAEISIRLDKDLKFVDGDSLIWNFGLPQFTPKMFGFECYGNGKSSRKSYVFVHPYIASKIFGNMIRMAA